MIENLKDIFSNPNDPNFWSAISLMVTILIATGGFLGWTVSKVSNNSISKTTRILVQSTVELYLDWVKVRSKEQVVNNETIRIWISESGGSIITARSYLVFKKFIKELKKQGYNDILLPEENTYNIWVTKYDGGTKWSRIEW